MDVVWFCEINIGLTEAGNFINVVVCINLATVNRSYKLFNTMALNISISIVLFRSCQIR